ncbi:hypothetical protein [Mycolicibacterium rutilum]|nr:hypothetical protein [Mycolicibacterium rutilum]
MWIVEVNFAGHQFTHRVHDSHRSLFRFAPRTLNWRAAQLRRTRAA